RTRHPGASTPIPGPAHPIPRRVRPSTHACLPQLQTHVVPNLTMWTQNRQISHIVRQNSVFSTPGVWSWGREVGGTMANWRDEVGAGESWDESSRPSTFRVRRFQSLRSREAPRLHSLSEDQLSGKPISEMLRFGITINDSSISSLTFEDQDAPGETRCSRKLIIVNAP